MDTLQAPASVHGAPGGDARALFGYEALRDGRVVTRMYGFESEGHRVRVAAEIYPNTARDDSPPEWFFSDFASQEHALRFAGEALVALEYLGCTVAEMDEAASGAKPTGRLPG